MARSAPSSRSLRPEIMLKVQSLIWGEVFAFVSVGGVGGSRLRVSWCVFGIGVDSAIVVVVVGSAVGDWVRGLGVGDGVVLNRVMVAIVVRVDLSCMLGVVCCERRGGRKEADLDGIYEWVLSFIVVVWKFGVGLVWLHKVVGEIWRLCRIMWVVVVSSYCAVW